MNNEEAVISINKFIKQFGYSYNCDDIIQGYIKRSAGYYNSYTMNHSLDNLGKELKVLVRTSKQETPEEEQQRILIEKNLMHTEDF